MMGSSWKDHWLLKIYPLFLSRLFAKASRGATVVSSSEGTYLIFLISLISLHFYYMQAMQQPVFFLLLFLLLLLQASIRWTHSRPNGQHEGKTCREAFPPCTITSQPAGVTDDPQCKYSIFRTLCVCTWGGEVGGVHIVNLGHPAAEAALQLMRGKDEGLAWSQCTGHVWCCCCSRESKEAEENPHCRVRGSSRSSKRHLVLWLRTVMRTTFGHKMQTRDPFSTQRNWCPRLVLCYWWCGYVDLCP